MKRKQLTFSEQIRRAINDCEVTRYAIYKQTGVSQATLSRFMNGHGSLSLESLDKIGAFIGLRVELDEEATKTVKPSGKSKKGK